MPLRKARRKTIARQKGPHQGVHKAVPRELLWVQRWSELLDAQFRIPLTQVRFGVDFLLGLVPGLGDAISMGISGLLIATMAKHGASGRLVGRMLGNVLLDAVVGSVPILGNVFDLFYKANLRNAKLMREYYQEGKHSRSVWPIVLAVLVCISVLFALGCWATFWVLNRMWTWVTGS